MGETHVNAPRLENDGIVRAGTVAGRSVRNGAGAAGRQSGNEPHTGHRRNAARSAGVRLAYVAPHL